MRSKADEEVDDEVDDETDDETDEQPDTTDMPELVKNLLHREENMKEKDLKYELHNKCLVDCQFL